jgi:flagellar biosynthesis regulator FlbT
MKEVTKVKACEDALFTPEQVKQIKSLKPGEEIEINGLVIKNVKQ